MLLQQQPSKVTCFPTALAMCLGVPVKDIIAAIGHNHSCHLQELQDYCMTRGSCIVPIDLDPGWENGDKLPGDNAKRTLWYISIFPTMLGFEKHVVACDGKDMYDPIGSVTPFTGLHGIKDVYVVGLFKPILI